MRAFFQPVTLCSATLLTALIGGALLEARADESIEGRYLLNVRQVTSGFVKAGEGYFSPDMTTIVYQAVRQQYPFYQIFTQPLAGGTPKLISTGRGRTTCSYFRPDGKRILFASSHLNPNLAKLEADERRQQAEEKQDQVCS